MRSAVQCQKMEKALKLYRDQEDILTYWRVQCLF